MSKFVFFYHDDPIDHTNTLPDYDFPSGFIVGGQMYRNALVPLIAAGKTFFPCAAHRPVKYRLTIYKRLTSPPGRLHILEIIGPIQQFLYRLRCSTCRLPLEAEQRYTTSPNDIYEHVCSDCVTTWIRGQELINPFPSLFPK